jgi:hypothetical protein
MSYTIDSYRILKHDFFFFALLPLDGTHQMKKNCTGMMRERYIYELHWTSKGVTDRLNKGWKN